LEPTIGSEGGASEFQPFFEREFAQLVRALVPTTASVGDAEEAVQEAMVRAYERWDRVSTLQSPAGYVYVTAINVHRRSRRRLGRLLFGRQVDVEASDAGLIDDFLERDLLVSRLALLPQANRDALLLVGWLGLGAAEAGEILKIKPASVRSRVHRARALLEKSERSDGDE